MLVDTYSSPGLLSRIKQDRNESDQIRKIEASDADEHAHNLTGWHRSSHQISNGSFQGSLMERRIPKMQVFHELISQAVLQSCCVSSDSFWFGIPAQPSTSRINGRLIDAQTMMVRPGRRDFELVTPADFSIYGIVIPREVLFISAERMRCRIDWLKLSRAEILPMPELVRVPFLQALKGLLAPPDSGSRISGLDSPHETLINALLNMLDTSKTDKGTTTSFQRRQGIVAKARDHMLAQRDQVISMPNLCQTLNVSCRTLQYCFENILGISPAHYLRILRLNGARRELLDKRSNWRTVQDVAAEWGVFCPSQFACNYRKLFCMSPNLSLKKRSL